MSLRAQVMRGGVYLAARQSLSLVLGLGGVIALTRILGPADYGVYAASLGIFAYLQTLSQWGINVYLVRREGELPQEELDQAFTLAIALGAAGAAAGWGITPALRGWTQLPGVELAVRVMCLGLPLSLVNQVALARLERTLNYRRVAAVELGGQLLFYSVALPLALRGVGIASPLAGWSAQVAWTTAGYFWGTGYRPRLLWRQPLVRRMVGFGLSFSSSIWVWQLRNLVSPLVVSRFAGPEAVTAVALSVRVVEALSFVKSATWRLSLAAISKMQGDRPRIVRAVSEGMRLQVLALGPLLLGFAVVGSLVLPRYFGSHWADALRVFPFVAVSYLANAVFNLHSSALYALQRNWGVTAFHAVHVALFAGAALILVPRFGAVGYGLAELVALGSYVVVHQLFVRDFSRPDYRIPMAWMAAFAVGCFAPSLGWWMAAGVVAVAGWPSTWSELKSILGTMQRLRRAQ